MKKNIKNIVNLKLLKKSSPILGMVHHHRNGVAGPSRLHLVACLLQVGCAPPGDVHGGASLPELQGDASADAAACPGDQGYAAVQRGGHLDFYAIENSGCCSRIGEWVRFW